MYLDDAIRSGRAFKRPNMQGWLDCEHGTHVTSVTSGLSYPLTIDDLLSEDWIIYGNSHCTRTAIITCVKEFIAHHAYLSKEHKELITELGACICKEVGV